MARRQPALRAQLLDLLAAAPEGLGLDDALRELARDNGQTVSARGVRDLLNHMAEDGEIVRLRRTPSGPGAPPYHYYHRDTAPPDPSALQTALELAFGNAQVNVATRESLETEGLRPDETQRRRQSTSVLLRIARGMIGEDSHAAVLLRDAEQLAALEPVQLVLDMARWVADDINALVEVLEGYHQASRLDEVERTTHDLNARLAWARRYFHGFWRLDRKVIGADPIFDIPPSASSCHYDGRRAQLSEEKARERLRQRIVGDTLVERTLVPTETHMTAAGTDAAITDIRVERGTTAFGGTTPISVMSAAAALVQREGTGRREFQDFDIFPDQLNHLDDIGAAANGFVLSPRFSEHLLPERDIRHTRMAALELRQYDEELRIVLRNAKWRPTGAAPSLGLDHRPTIIFRDGRTFPLVHRLRDYEAPGLYGQIVRNQVEKFSQVLHHAFSGPWGEVVYGAVVKTPEMSWLSPLVFWYLHAQATEVRGQRVVADAADVYRPPFTDSVVAHLVFLGLSRRPGPPVPPATAVAFRTCVVLRRFIDIAFEDEQLPAMVRVGLHRRQVNEDSESDWTAFLQEHIRDKIERENESYVAIDAYRPFVYLCARAAVAMCYGAPTALYEPFADASAAEAPQFLLPRLEVAVNMRNEPRERAVTHLGGMLGWLASGGGELTRHVRSGESAGDTNSLPVIVPDVIALAHEAAVFAKRVLGEEVEERLRQYVALLRQQFVGRTQ